MIDGKTKFIAFIDKNLGGTDSRDYNRSEVLCIFHNERRLSFKHMPVPIVSNKVVRSRTSDINAGTSQRDSRAHITAGGYRHQRSSCGRIEGFKNVVKTALYLRPRGAAHGPVGARVAAVTEAVRASVTRSRTLVNCLSWTSRYAQT